MSWRKNVKNWNGKLYKILLGNKSCHGGNFEWSLPEGDKPGDWTPIIEDVEMCERGYHLTTHYAHWSDIDRISIYEAEGDVVEFDGFDTVVCSRVRLLKLIEDPFYETNFGVNNSGHGNSGYKNSGDYNTGDQNSGNYNTGNRNSGRRNLGDCNSGDYNFGSYNSGNNNFGNNNFGSFNSSNNNIRFLCSTSLPSEIFDKPIPENWEPRFPEWMNFELLSEGYYESWQKAFEKADIKGIKELLFLPNFDYEIFEKISSITRKQIEEKLNEVKYDCIDLSNELERRKKIVDNAPRWK